MYIRSVRLDGARDQLIDETDNRSLAGEVLEPLCILFDRLGSTDNLLKQAGRIAGRIGLGIQPVSCGF